MPEGTDRRARRSPSIPILAGLGGDWPLLLGVNEVEARDRADVEVLARLPEDQGGHPLLVIGRHGKGRTAAWTSDIGPHWLSPAFCEWEGYGRLWKNLLGWLTRGALRGLSAAQDRTPARSRVGKADRVPAPADGERRARAARMAHGAGVERHAPAQRRRASATRHERVAGAGGVDDRRARAAGTASDAAVASQASRRRAPRVSTTCPTPAEIGRERRALARGAGQASASPSLRKAMSTAARARRRRAGAATD